VRLERAGFTALLSWEMKKQKRMKLDEEYRKEEKNVPNLFILITSGVLSFRSRFRIKHFHK